MELCLQRAATWLGVLTQSKWNGLPGVAARAPLARGGRMSPRSGLAAPAGGGGARKMPFSIWRISLVRGGAVEGSPDFSLCHIPH